jgi:hypothetical protein
VPWFKVDDKLHDHRKARAAGCQAMGLWVLAGSWCGDNLTDGFVPDSIAARWDRNYRKLAGRLVEVGLWEVARKDGEAGWQFHEWAPTNPLREKVLADREAAAARMAKVRANKSKRSGERAANVQRTFANPDPTRPDPPVPGVGSRSLPDAADVLADLKAVEPSPPPPGWRDELAAKRRESA